MTRQEMIEIEAQNWFNHAAEIIAKETGQEVSEIVVNPETRKKMVEAAGTIAWGIVEGIIS